ncbi:MAG: hypothetical protein ABJL54_08925 [Halioglobus sp.]
MLVRIPLLLVLLVSVALLYLPGLSGPFIFDDGPAITGNPHLQFDPSVADEWRTAAFSSASGPLRRPIAMLTFAGNYAISAGITPLGIKLTNLFIHLACGGLVYCLAGAVFGYCLSTWSNEERSLAALFAAGLWLLSPLHVSTVLYSVQRMAQLTTFFVLMGLVVFSFARSRWAQKGATLDDVVANLLWLSLCLFLAVFSKENGALLLWLIVVLEVTLFNGVWGGRDSRILRWLGYFTLCLPLLLFSGLALHAPEYIVAGYQNREFSMVERALTQLRVLWQYLGWLIVPDINAMGFQHDDIDISRSWFSPVTTAMAGAAWLGVLIFYFVFRNRYPLFAMATLFYLVGHSLESSFWPLEMVYEHRNYLPSVGIYIALGGALFLVTERAPIFRRRIVVGLFISVFSVALLLRAFVWGDALRLNAVNVANHPASSRSHYFMAETALQYYDEARSTGHQAEESSKAQLLQARQHLELMYQADPQDLAALFMLYYMDQNYFPQLQAYTDWFALLLEASKVRTLQASDYNSLNALVACFAASACGDAAKLGEILDQLLLRYPKSVELMLMRYRYLGLIETTRAARLALLDDIQAESPGTLEVYQMQIVARYEAGDLYGTMEAIKSLLDGDEGRYQLTTLKRLFGASASIATDL